MELIIWGTRLLDSFKVTLNESIQKSYGGIGVKVLSK